jgi:hypothetical protein
MMRFAMLNLIDSDRRPNPRRPRISHKRPAAVVTTAFGMVLAGVVSAGPASASVIDRGRYVDPYTYSFDACGTTVDVTGVASGHFLERLRGHQPLSYVAEHFVNRATYTNTHTHRSWNTVIRFTHLDLSITHLNGTIYRGTGQDAGTFSVYDSAGRLYYRDAGNRKFIEVFDVGTDQSLSYDVVSVGHFNDSNLCADLKALTTG